jgi:hypothetical protein
LQAPLEHPTEHGHFPVEVIEDQDVPLPDVVAVETAGVLDEGPLPRYGQCQEESIEPGVVEALSDIATRREDEPFLVAWDRFSARPCSLLSVRGLSS